VAARTDRLPASTFRLPVEKIRAGYYSDSYFVLTKELLEAEGRHPRVTMQVFAKHHGLLGGIDEAIALLREGAGRAGPDGSWEPGWEQLQVMALHEGEEIAPLETVLTITGDYTLFAHLETVYLGSLARRSLVMTNVREVVDAAAGKPVIFFPARHDHWLVQTGDGWAAHVAGAIGVSTDAQASWWGGRGVGTVPHSLIAAYGGDTVAAGREFAARYRDEVNVVVLVDFHNDSVRGGRRRRGARRRPLGRPPRHLRAARRPRPAGPGRRRRAARRRPRARGRGPRGARRGGPRAGPDRRLRRLRHRQDRPLRGGRRPGRLLRGRLGAAAGRVRLHRRRGRARGRAGGEGGPGAAAEPAAAAGRVALAPWAYSSTCTSSAWIWCWP
jgi:quinolinate phosphoribosyl transferase-like protein